MNDDMDLVHEYAASRSEAAFETLVSRHLNLVYSSACRQVSDAALAQDIAQAVFIILAQKAGSLGPRTILSGWLYRTTRYACADALKIQRRRQHREQEAFMQSQPSAPEVWLQIAPLLDEAMAQLDDKDRNVILLRYFENKSARDIADALGLEPPAAQKRLTRAVEKLRAYFAKRQLPHSAAEIAESISANSVCLAPAGLAKTIAVVGAAKGATAGGSTLVLVKGALKIMAWTHAKTALLIGAGCLLAAGTATVAVVQKEKPPAYPWQALAFPNDGTGIHGDVLDKGPRLVDIRPTVSTEKNLTSEEIRGTPDNWLEVVGSAVTVKRMILIAYGYWMNEYRVIVTTPLPPEPYDYIDDLPRGAMPAFQDLIKKKFGVTGRIAAMETDVLLLQLKNTNAPGLRPSAPGAARQNSQTNGADFMELHTIAVPFTEWVNYCERTMQIPVLDRTGLRGNYDMDLKWHWANRQYDKGAFKQDILDQLGLELVPTRETIDMLIIERAKK